MSPSNHGRSFLLIGNPAAGKGRGDQALAAAERVLRDGGAQVQVSCTSGPGDAERFGRAAAGGSDVVVAVGGDGTLHEILGGLLSAESSGRPTLGVVPVGTGNDYAKMLGVPGRDPETAARILLEGPLRTVDVGFLEGTDRGPEYFCNNIGLAFMGAANAAHGALRSLPGRLSYPIGGFGAFVRFKPELMTVSVDAVDMSGRFMVVHIGLGRFCGGGVCLTPEARLDDGKLDVCLVAERSKLKCFLQWPQMAAGKVLDDMSVLSGTRIRVQGPRDMLIHADGEVRRVPMGVLVATLQPQRLDVIHAP